MLVQFHAAKNTASLKHGQTGRDGFMMAIFSGEFSQSFDVASAGFGENIRQGFD